MSFTFLWRVLNANCRVAISLVLCIELQQKSKEKQHRIIRKVHWSVIVLMSDWEVVCVAGASCMWSRLDKLRRAISRLPRKPLMSSFHRKHRTTFRWPCRYISHFSASSCLTAACDTQRVFVGLWYLSADTNLTLRGADWQYCRSCFLETSPGNSPEISWKFVCLVGSVDLCFSFASSVIYSRPSPFAM